MIWRSEIWKFFILIKFDWIQWILWNFSKNVLYPRGTEKTTSTKTAATFLHHAARSELAVRENYKSLPCSFVRGYVFRHCYGNNCPPGPPRPFLKCPYFFNFLFGYISALYWDSIFSPSQVLNYDANCAGLHTLQFSGVVYKISQWILRPDVRSCTFYTQHSGIVKNQSFIELSVDDLSDAIYFLKPF